MKTFLLFCLVAAAAVSARPEDQYTDKYDDINLDQILSNERLLSSYVKCLLGTGKCSTEGKELVSNMKDAMEHNCAKCTSAQQKGTRRVIGYLINNKPEYWQQLTQKFDPDNKYAHKYEAELRTLKA